MGSVRVANQAGTAPNSIPVSSARPDANARTKGAGRASIGRNVVPAKARVSRRRAVPIATSKPAIPPPIASRMLSTSACVTICRREAPIHSKRCTRSARRSAIAAAASTPTVARR